MAKHYTKNMGEITYVYDVDLEEHKKVIETQQKRIAELEQELAELKTKYEECNKERLENRVDYLNTKNKLNELKEKAIIPKFKVGQEVWHFITGKPIKDIIVRNDLFQYELSALKFGMDEDYLFATEQETQEKLKEIQGNE